MKKDNKKVAFLKIMEDTLGNVSKACEKVNIARSTYYDWLKKDSDFAEKVDEVVEGSLDFAESALKKQIRKGNVTAIIFYLKTKGKERGYVESKKIEADTNLNVEGSLPKIDLELVGGEDS